MKPTYRVFLILFAIPFVSLGQSDVDALRYSQSSLAGTARYVSMGGAFGALGGDFSTLAWNPAGIAIYRKSEFTFSPSLYIEKSSSDFLGNASKESRYNFNFGNIGLVLTRKLSNNDTSYGWKNWNFGIGYNRINNFHTKWMYQGINQNNSLLDYLAESANGIAPGDLDPFTQNLAYQTYLINPDVNNNYYSVIPNGGVLQRRSVTTKGSMGEIDLSFGANYSNKLYLGATVGFGTIRYIEDATYEEVDPADDIPSFNNFRFNQHLATHGYGVNLKLGLIYRPLDLVRFGVAFHTPTFYTMKDDYSNSMHSNFDTLDVSFDSPNGSFDYELSTPMRVVGSLAFIIGQMGLVSADYEFVDYSEAQLESNDYAFFDENSNIGKKYTATGNLRLGTEWRYQNFSFRGGFAWMGSPFSDLYKPSGADMTRTSYSVGIGIRDRDYFIDLGYVLTEGTEFYQPYFLTYEDVPGVKNKMQSHNFTITFGAKF